MFGSVKLRRKCVRLSAENRELRRRIASAEALCESLKAELDSYTDTAMSLMFEKLAADRALSEERDRTDYLRRRLAKHEAVHFGDCELFFNIEK